MKSEDLKKELEKHPHTDVYVQVENWLYYPIKNFKIVDGKLIIVCTNIQKVK